MEAESRGYRINYLSFGEADQTMVLLHGHLQAGEDWVTAGYPDLLTPTHRVLAIDLLGYGDSDKPHDVEAYQLDGHVADVVAVLDAAGIDRATLWGYSMGVVTAGAFAKQCPDRTVALIAGGNLVNASADDRRNLSMEGAARLEQVGVGAYIDESWPFITPEVRELFVRRNDPLAASAAARGQCARHAAEDAPLPDATLNYMGTDEPWFELVKAVALEQGVAFEAVPGDHGGAFQAANVITPKVLTFLRSA
jgi:pimeloyl-ACP methyl ester carboxylesterase